MATAQRIIDLYNENSALPFDEQLDLGQPENTRIITVANDTAGVLLDHHTDQNIWRIMFAAFDAENRSRGYLRSCLDAAEKAGLDIALVEINNASEKPVWEKLGFDQIGTMGMCFTLSNRKLDFINYDSVMY